MLTLGFDSADCLDARLVGGKAHGLAKMSQGGIPVSPGYVVSAAAYRQYLSTTGLHDKIEAVLRSVDHASISALDSAAQSVEAWFKDVAMPADHRAAIAQDYERLCGAVGVPDVSVAVRSSATAEDSAGASFAGEYETFVGVRGVDGIELHIRRCWASAFTARALTYAWKNSISPLDVDMAVVVQKTVNARAAGVMFTLSPVTGDRSRIFIEASYGLGLGVVGGDVTPDRYVVAKIEGTIVDRVLGDKHIEYSSSETFAPVDDERRQKFCLEDREVVALAKLGKGLERSHGMPLDIEFAVDRELAADRNIVLLQCRPETVWSSKRPKPQAGAANSVSAAILASVRKS